MLCSGLRVMEGAGYEVFATPQKRGEEEQCMKQIENEPATPPDCNDYDKDLPDIFVGPRDDPRPVPWYRSGPVNPTTERLEKYMKRAVRFRRGAKRSREVLEREERDTAASIRSHEWDVARLKKKANKLEAKRQEAAKEEARLGLGCQSAREVLRLRGIFQLQEPLIAPTCCT